MSKLFAVLMIALVQFQPMSDAFLCGWHQESGASMPMPMPGSSDHHDEQAPTPDHTPQHADCPFMRTCAVTAPAPVPVTFRVFEWQPATRVRFVLQATYPTDVVARPPFHPPSA